MDDISRHKARYAQLIENGRKIEVFTSMPEWQWYVKHVLQPTIEENIEKIIRGDIKSEKEEWIVRGVVQALRMVTDGAEGIQSTAAEAKKKARDLQKFLRTEQRED